jgi:hypothetical protein
MDPIDKVLAVMNLELCSLIRGANLFGVEQRCPAFITEQTTSINQPKKS